MYICYFFGQNIQYIFACCCCAVLSHVRPFVTLCSVACQAPLPMEFPRQEYCNGRPFPPTEDLPSPGIDPTSPVSPAWQAVSLPLSHLGSPYFCIFISKITLGLWMTSIISSFCPAVLFCVVYSIK